MPTPKALKIAFKLGWRSPIDDVEIKLGWEFVMILSASADCLKQGFLSGPEFFFFSLYQSTNLRHKIIWKRVVADSDSCAVEVNF